LGGVYEMYALVVWGQTVIGGVMASKDIWVLIYRIYAY
jgi:hypothetical protein